MEEEWLGWRLNQPQQLGNLGWISDFEKGLALSVAHRRSDHEQRICSGSRSSQDFRRAASPAARALRIPASRRIEGWPAGAGQQGGGHCHDCRRSNPTCQDAGHGAIVAFFCAFRGSNANEA
jgi:hypothetical protein